MLDRGLRALLAGAVLALSVSAALGQSLSDFKRSWETCQGADLKARVAACTELLEDRLSDGERVIVHGNRAIARRRLGDYPGAFADYGEALRIDPKNPYIRNNRAWAYYKSGRFEEGLADIELALAVAAPSAPWLDTRGHIYQALGRSARAYDDYHTAMRIGGEIWVKRYQCGMRNAGHFKGDLDGKLTAALLTALRACVADRKCDPLPDDDECRQLTS
ncbi:MAG TPA: tetratricopeptide repeat protein [Hyphomicrobiaceae bacterium]|nr:tetratricopeptide repeat protein [Hyphomicrobiaceae bacterium]